VTVKRHILPVMARRLPAFILALVVTTGPAAILACELTCMGQDSSRGGPSHTCHPAKPADTASTINAVHACGHGDGLPAALGKMTAQGVAGPAIVAAAPQFLLDAAGIPRRSSRVASSPPGPPKAATPLRI
jgi:hypothetical protein